MSKAPLIVDIVLGEMHGNINGTETGAYVNLYGTGQKLTAKQLRDLADKVDQMNAAAMVFYGITEREYAITWNTGNGEDGVVILAGDPVLAARKFYAEYPHEIKSMYDRQMSDYVDFPNRTPRDYQ